MHVIANKNSVSQGSNGISQPLADLKEADAERRPNERSSSVADGASEQHLATARTPDGSGPVDGCGPGEIHAVCAPLSEGGWVESYAGEVARIEESVRIPTHLMGPVHSGRGPSVRDIQDALESGHGQGTDVRDIRPVCGAGYSGAGWTPSQREQMRAYFDRLAADEIKKGAVMDARA